ncbi:uncharacterized protein LOC110706234 [Chenopodium quinoa]|uniref:uncharacterized protein LOC110706234 n=1 Tax=Chenopodium quinoa TaxID=63459 RepID=UPI000B779F67|nr:uncharacterized protein LOC110706234 [Chenopodium quinoa]
MDLLYPHPEHNNETSRSISMAESRIGNTDCNLLDLPCLSPNPTVSVSVQDTMARTRKTVVDPNYRGGGSDELPPDERAPNETAMGSPRGIPSTPSDSILGSGQGGGEEVASVERRNSSQEASSSASGSTLDPVERSSIYLTPSVDSEEEERPSWQTKGDPLMITVSTKDRAMMQNNLADFVLKRPLGTGYRLVVPPAKGTIAWEDDQCNADDWFGCYEAAFLAGLRFPLHDTIKAILRGYGLGIWQLTPKCWVNILGYIAACEMQDLNPGWEAFAHMHYLSRSPGGWRAWYTLTTYPQYLMTLDKPSKWLDWKSHFYLVKAPTNEENREFPTYNRKPELLGQKCQMPPVPERDREAILDSHFFELVPSTLSTGEVIRVPKHEFLRDEAFLSACGLSSMFEKRRLKASSGVLMLDDYFLLITMLVCYCLDLDRTYLICVLQKKQRTCCQQRKCLLGRLQTSARRIWRKSLLLRRLRRMGAKLLAPCKSRFGRSRL